MHNSLWLEVPAKQNPLLKKKKMCVSNLSIFFTDLLTTEEFHNSPEFFGFQKEIPHFVL